MQVEKIACKVEFFPQNRLQVNEILIFLVFKLMMPLNLLVWFQLLHIIIIIYQTYNVK
jgi:hypothetical protein